MCALLLQCRETMWVRLREVQHRYEPASDRRSASVDGGASLLMLGTDAMTFVVVVVVVVAAAAAAVDDDMDDRRSGAPRYLDPNDPVYAAARTSCCDVWRRDWKKQLTSLDD